MRLDGVGGGPSEAWSVGLRLVGKGGGTGLGVTQLQQLCMHVLPVSA